MHPTKQFAIYSRKSRFTGKGESVENQVEMCRQYLRAHYGEEALSTVKVYEDEGFSGGTLDRPKFQQMMKDSHRMGIDAVVVYRLDRISRNIGDFAALITDLRDRGIEFISIREQFDTSSPMGRAMMYIASVFSQLERETIAERIRDNLHELAKTGRWLGGITPTGYEVETVVKPSADGKAKKSCRLKIIPEEKETVALMFHRFIETGSLTKTAEFLEHNRCLTKNNIPFSRFAIKNILCNPVYMQADGIAYRYLSEHRVALFSDKDAFDGTHGVMVYNRTLQRTGKAHKVNPCEEWIAAVGGHRGIVSGAIWVKVQSLLEANRSTSHRPPRSNVALLSGLLRCAECGAPMRPKASGRVDASGDVIYSYICKAKERTRSEACHIKNANGNALDRSIVALIQSLGESTDELIVQLELARGHLLSEHGGPFDAVASIKARIGKEEGELRSLTAALAKAQGSVAERYVLTQIDEAHHRMESLKDQLRTLESIGVPNRLDSIEPPTTPEHFLGSTQRIDQCTVEEKRDLIRRLVHKVTWDGSVAHVYLLGCTVEDAPPTLDGEPL